jgi:hypothetical protein
MLSANSDRSSGLIARARRCGPRPPSFASSSTLGLSNAEFNWGINAGAGLAVSRAECRNGRGARDDQEAAAELFGQCNLANQPLHVADGLLQANHNCAGDDAVADVELVHPVDGGDWLHVTVGQAVAGVQRDAGSPNLLAGFD